MVQYGHPPKLSLPTAAKLLNFTATTTAGTTPLVASADAGGAPVLTASFDGLGKALVSASYDNGYWVQLKDGSYRNASKQMVPDAQKSMWSVKYVKGAFGPDAPWDQPIGQTLEIVPLQAPSAAGSTIQVRVLFEGRPVAGSTVKTIGGDHHGDGQSPAVTDAQGTATVPLGEGGPQVLSVSYRVTPSRTPTLADADAYDATFSFTTAAAKTN